MTRLFNDPDQFLAWSDRAGGTSGALWGAALRPNIGRAQPHADNSTAHEIISSQVCP